MSLNHRLASLGLEAMAELKAEEKSLQIKPEPASPYLDSVLAEIGSLPREALFLGVAADGLPVLLNLHDPLPGPVLITGDAGVGKTRFLQTISLSMTRTHSPKEVQFAVITSRVDEWANTSESSHRVGIFSASQTGAQDCILSLTSWAHSSKSGRQSILLLIDDLEAMASMDVDVLQNFRWLLSRGTSRRVWPFVAMNATRYGQVLSWIPAFRTRIFGRMSDPRIAGAVGVDQPLVTQTLEAPIQFSLRENGGWLKFWVPSF